MDTNTLTSAPPQRLVGFEDYDDFVQYAQTLFSLTEEEYEGLYRVLLKLQGIGEEPIETMNLWKAETCQEGCVEFIRFMIQVDSTDLEMLKAVA